MIVIDHPGTSYIQCRSKLWFYELTPTVNDWNINRLQAGLNRQAPNITSYRKVPRQCLQFIHIFVACPKSKWVILIDGEKWWKMAKICEVDEVDSEGTVLVHCGCCRWVHVALGRTCFAHSTPGHSRQRYSGLSHGRPCIYAPLSARLVGTPIAHDPLHPHKVKFALFWWLAHLTVRAHLDQ